MTLLDFPDKDLWQQRYDWVDKELDDALRGTTIVSDHATALFMELQACYCIGAWLSVIILSVSVIDAQLRETEAMDSKIGTAKLLSDYYAGEEIDWLRRLRNKYVHIDIDNPALNIDMQYGPRKELEADATKAIKMVISAIFQSPGT